MIIHGQACKDATRCLLKLNHEICEREMKKGIYKPPKNKFGVVNEPSTAPLFGEGNLE